jgi:hypothetical protein
VYVFTHLLTNFVITLQSLIPYNVSTYDYCITVTQSSLEVCAKTVGHTVMPRCALWHFAVSVKKDDQQPFLAIGG